MSLGKRKINMLRSLAVGPHVLGVVLALSTRRRVKKSVNVRRVKGPVGREGKENLQKRDSEKGKRTESLSGVEIMRGREGREQLAGVQRRKAVEKEMLMEVAG